MTAESLPSVPPSHNPTEPSPQLAGPRVFWSNFDCEWDWAQWYGSQDQPQGGENRGRPRDRRPPPILQAAAEKTRLWRNQLAWCWLPLARAGDLIVGGEGGQKDRSPFREADLPADVWEGVGFVPRMPPHCGGRLVPWGWTDGARQLALQGGVAVTSPLPTVVAEVNSRCRRWEWEQQLGLALPGSCPIASLGELTRALLSLPDPEAGWVLKANFGMSGREAIRGRGLTVTEPQRRFVEQRLEATGPLVLEPWLTAVAEAGVQWDLAPDGRITLVGVAEQRVAGGTWQGSRFSGSVAGAAWHAAIEATERVAQRVAAAGYWGPLGIDCMRYRDVNGGERLRPLQDLNARFTMGRLTLAWRDHLPAGWSAAWRVIPPHATGAVEVFCEQIGTSRTGTTLAWRTTPGIAAPPANDSARRESFPAGRCLLAACDNSRLDSLEHDFEVVVERSRHPV